MAKYGYSTTIGEREAAAVGRALPISTKHAIEICTFVRGKSLERVKTMLSLVAEERMAVPFRRFTNGPGHRRGKISSGGYPRKASLEILNIVNSAQANAQFKGLSSSDLVVRHISAQKAAKAWRYGRRRLQAKRTNIEVVLSEVKAPEKKAEKQKEKKETKAKEAKAVE